MAAYVWPVTLPQVVNRNMGGDGGVRVLRSPMDRGMPKTRYIGERAELLNVKFHMSTAQLAILKDFILNTLKGVARFDFEHPVTGAVVEVCIVPADGDGQMYTYEHHGFEQWIVTMKFQVQP